MIKEKTSIKSSKNSTTKKMIERDDDVSEKLTRFFRTIISRTNLKEVFEFNFDDK